jgi:hypothetical protein
MTDQVGGTLSAAKVIISEYFTCKSLQFKILRRSPPSTRKVKSLRMSVLRIHTKGDCEELEDKYLFHHILVVSPCGVQYFARFPKPSKSLIMNSLLIMKKTMSSASLGAGGSSSGLRSR